jgi:hypothetical protein
MSNLLSQASLVMIPSGYKEDIVYSVIPTSGAGDLSFTRASNGTRINSAGLVEVTPWNMAEYSEDFSNAAWVKSASATTITTNSTTAPNGTTTADTWTINAAGARYVGQTKTVTAGAVTASFFVKKGTSDWFYIRIDDGTNYAGYTFDVATGQLGQSVSSVLTPIASIVDFGNGWYRCIVATTVAVTSITVSGWVATSATTISGLLGASLICWGAQLNIGSTAKPYFPTTDRLNVPRLTYQNGGGGCPSLLLEKQSTNLLTYSQDFTQSSWQKLGQGIADTAVITANYAISPDGTQNATRFVCNLNGSSSASDRSWMIQTFTPQANSTISIWIKLNTSGTKNIIFSDGGGDIKTISGTDWQRIDTTFSGASGEFRIGLIGSTGSSDTLDCCIWGAQAESGSYPTSYIPTTSASATRVADACSKTGISSLIGQSEGVVYVEYDQKLINQGITRRIFALSDGTVNNRITAYINTGNGIDFYVRNSGGDLFLGTVASPVGNTTGMHKIASAYKNGDYAVYLDGALIISGAGTAGTIPACSRFDLGSQIGSNDLYEPMMQSLLFPTRLTNAELASLTTI